MQVEIKQDLETRRAPRGVPTPWLKGRATKWQLTRDYILILDGRAFCVPAGYVFNGSSIPWWLWWLFPPSYGPAWRAAGFHDYAYSHLYHEVSKQFADQAFHDIMVYDKAQPAIASGFHWAVSTFGRGGWDGRINGSTETPNARQDRTFSHGSGRRG